MTTPDKQPLKPCPFCCYAKISEDDISGNRDMDSLLYWVECGMCGAQGPSERKEAMAVAEWNRRAHIEELEAALKIAGEALGEMKSAGDWRLFPETKELAKSALALIQKTLSRDLPN